MNIQQQEHGAVLVVRPDGPLAGKDASQCRSALDEALRDKLGRVVLDASAIRRSEDAFVDELIGTAPAWGAAVLTARCLGAPSTWPRWRRLRTRRTWCGRRTLAAA